MELTRQHLAPIFEDIARLLGPTPGQLEQFEPWATEQAQRLRRSAEIGTPSLAFEAELLQDELSHLVQPLPAQNTSADRMRQCQRLWLTGLIGFVDELLEDGVTASKA